MSLRFFLGAAGAGKTRACLDEICDELVKDPLSGKPLYFLVPEQATFQMERALLSHRPDVSAAARARVVSFKRLAALALEDAGWGGRPLLGEMGKLLALQAVVSRRRGELRLFGPISRMDGFLEQLSAAISELRAYRHRPEGLAAVAELLKDEGPVADKLHDLALLYKDYDAFVARQFHDPETTLDLASDALATSSLVKGAEVWVDGFAGFTPQEYGVLEALFTACRRVTVALCLDPFELGGDMDAWTEGGPGDHFHPTRETLVALRDRARSLGVPIEPPRIFGGGIPPRFRGSPVLAELERVVARGWRARRSRERREAGAPVRQAAGAEATAGAPVPAVEVIEAPDPRAEVEAAAREITRLVREQGMRYSDVAVITRDVGPYKELIEAVFARWRIPYFLDAKDPAFHHPLITFVRACLDTAAHGLDTERVIRYLKTDLAPVSRAEADLLENEALRLGIQGEEWLHSGEWPERGGSRSRTVLDAGEVARIRRRALEPLARFVQRVRELSRAAGESGGRAPVSRYLELLWQLLEECGAEEKVASWIDEAAARDEALVVQEHRQVWQGVVRLFDQLEAVLGQETVTPGEMAEIAASALKRLRIGRVPPRIDQVLVGSVERSRQPDLRAAIILGANEGLFPKAPDESALFLDDERALLEAAGVPLGPGSTARLWREQYLVYIALTRASERLAIVYSRADERGRPKKPSYFVERILAACEGSVKTVLPAAGLPEPWPSRPGGLVPWLTRHLARLKEGAPGVPRERLLAAYRWLLEHPGAGLLPVDRTARGPQADPLEALAHRRRDVRLSPDLVRALYGDPLVLSPSGLESFAACPFSFFAGYGLRLEERPVYRLDAALLGQIGHAVLRRFVQELGARGLDWARLTRDESDALVEELAAACVAEVTGEPEPARRADAFALERLVKAVQAVVWALGEHARRGAFRPEGVEVAFGPRGPLPALDLSLTGGQRAQLRGRIDRIDAARWEGRSYLRVVDYKSSKHSFDLARLVHGLDLQLALYLAAAVEAAGGRAEPAGFLYQPVFDPLVAAENPPEDPEREWRRQLKAAGLIVDDGVVPRLMDSGAQDSSELVPLVFKKDGGLAKKSSVADPASLKRLLDYAVRRAGELAQAVARGETKAEPYQMKGRRACEFCVYLPVCQFDSTLPGDRYRNLPAYEKEEAWERMAQGGEAADAEQAG